MAANEIAAGVVWRVSKELWQSIEPILMKEGTPKTEGPPVAVSGATDGQTNVVVVEVPFYIVAPSPLADEQNRVLKHGETFAVFDHHGDIRPAGLGEEGLYYEGTRFLSASLLRLGKGRPLFLSSTVQEDNALLTVDLPNPDIVIRYGVVVPPRTLHLFRSRFLLDGRCYERLRVRNYGLAAVTTSFSLHFRADFADIFEVRGMKRERRGEDLPPVVGEGFVVLAYRGLDGIE